MATVLEIRTAVDRLHCELKEVAKSAEPASWHWKKDETTWSIAQIIAHVAEFECFFADDVRRLHAEPGTRFGRTMEHEQRLNAVALNGGESVHSLLSNMNNSQRCVTEVLSELLDEDLDIEGVNPKFGTKTIEWVVAHFIVEHLEKHLDQLRRTLDAYSST